MTTLWGQYLDKFADTLSKSAEDWSRAQAHELWDELARGPLNRCLFRFVLRQGVRNPDDAEDVLEDCLGDLAIQRSYRPNGQGPKGFRSWIYACLRNQVCRFTTRSAKRSRFVPLTGFDEDETRDLGTDERRAADKIEAGPDAETMLKSLATPNRDILQQWLEGKDDEEIAEGLNLTPGNVRIRRFRAIREIRKHFGISIRGRFRRGR